MPCDPIAAALLHAPMVQGEGEGEGEEETERVRISAAI